jgi:ABC-type branched-subunit amino acid transport system substrate-binding protein
MLIDAVLRMNRNPIIVLLASAAFAFTTLLVAGGCQRTPRVVKIGLVGPFEGRHRDIGYDVIYSARLAVREENGVLDEEGYRVSLVALDDFGDPDTAKEIARSLIIDPAVIAVVGHWLTDTTAVAAPLYEEAGLPFIEAGALPFDMLPYAGAGYDSIRLILAAIAAANVKGVSLDRTTIANILPDVNIAGVTGSVYQP